MRKDENERLCTNERHRAENCRIPHIPLRYGKYHCGYQVERSDKRERDDPEYQKRARIRVRFHHKAVCTSLSRSSSLPFEQRVPPDIAGDRLEDERKDGFQNGDKNKNQQQLPPHISPLLPHLPALLYFFILYSKRAA